MTVNKELFKGKRLADGSFPVMIRISDKGRIRRISTGVRVAERCWDSGKRRVIHKDKSFRSKNESIESLYGKILESPHDWLPKRKSVITPDYPFLSLIDRKIETLTRLNTRRGYECFKRWMENFDRHLSVKHVSQKLIDRIAQTLLEDKGKSNAMRNLYINWLRGVCSYGRKEGYIPSDQELSFPCYPHRSVERNLSDLQLMNIVRLGIKAITDDTGLNKLSTLAVSIFILDILLQGPAPVDLANIKAGQFVKVRVPMADGTLFEGLSLTLSRRKTGNTFIVMIEKSMADMILEPFLRDKEDNDYLIPCFGSHEQLSDKQRHYRLANRFHSFSVALNRMFKAAGITEECVNVTYYYARHAYCNLLDRLDIPPHIIRRMIGHTPGVLERHYLQGMTPADHAYIARELALQFKDWIK